MRLIALLCLFVLAVSARPTKRSAWDVRDRPDSWRVEKKRTLDWWDWDGHHPRPSSKPGQDDKKEWLKRWKLQIEEWKRQKGSLFEDWFKQTYGWDWKTYEANMQANDI